MWTYAIIALVIGVGVASYFVVRKKYNEVVNGLMKRTDLLSDIDELDMKVEMTEIEDKLKSTEDLTAIAVQESPSTRGKKRIMDKGQNVDNSEVLNLEIFEPTEDVVSLVDGASPKKETIDYEYLKGVYQTEEFLKSFRNATLLNLKLKRDRYLVVLKQIAEEYKVAKRNCPSSLIPNPRYQEQVDSLGSVNTEIKDILKQIKVSEKEISEQGLNWVNKRLTSAFTDKENGLDALIGRTDIKDFIALRLYTFAHNPKVFSSSFQNIVLYAAPGHGKTKIAQTIGWVYSRCGMLIREKFQQVTASSLSTAYVNESGGNTKLITFQFGRCTIH